MLSAGDLEARRAASSGENDVLALHEARLLAGRDAHRVLVDKRAKARDAVDLELVHAALVDAVEALDVAVAVALERGPVEARALDGDAEVVRLVDRVHGVRRVEHHLLRHAAHVHAGAAVPRALDERH